MDNIEVFREYNEKVKPYLTNIKKYRIEGKSMSDIAALLGVSELNICTMFKEIGEFREAYNSVDIIFLSKLEAQLYKECMGYYVEEQTSKGLVTKYIRPDTKLLAATVKVLNPDKWDRPEESRAIEIKIDPELIDYSE